jgi:putative ABC transport system substrate-binding protein
MIKIKLSKTKISIFLISILILAVAVAACFLVYKKIYEQNEVGTAKIYHVGILAGLSFFDDTTTGFKSGMEKLGYKEGENIVYDLEKTDFDAEAYKRILTKFINNKVDLIFVFPTEAALMAKSLAKESNIPVLFANASLEGVDLVKDLNKPGENITGVRRPDQEIVVERFNIMRTVLPEAKKMLIPYQRGYPIVAGELEKLRLAAEGTGVEFIEMPVDNGTELETNLQKYIQMHGVDFDAVLLIAEPIATVEKNILIMSKELERYKIPIGGVFFNTSDLNTFFGVNVDNVVAGQQASPLADKILKGTPPGTISVVSAKIFLQVNLKAALALGLKIDESILSQANEVVK